MKSDFGKWYSVMRLSATIWFTNQPIYKITILGFNQTHRTHKNTDLGGKNSMLSPHKERQGIHNMLPNNNSSETIDG